MSRLVSAVLAVGLCMAPPGAGAVAGPQIVKVGSLAPEGTPWHLMIQDIGEEWARISNGRVALRIYPGGVLGDEPDMLKKMRIGQIQALGVTTVGLSRIDPSIQCLQLPMQFDTYEELDFVRDRMEAKLEAIYERKGAVMLGFIDAGWVHFFTRKPVSTIDEIRKLKLFVWAGDLKSLQLWTLARFTPVPLPVTDMMMGLQTGLIDVLDAPPLVVMANQWFGIANHMMDLRWAPLLGGLAIDRRAWERFPAAQRPAMRDAARKAVA